MFPAADRWVGIEPGGILVGGKPYVLAALCTDTFVAGVRVAGGSRDLRYRLYSWWVIMT